MWSAWCPKNLYAVVISGHGVERFGMVVSCRMSPRLRRDVFRPCQLSEFTAGALSARIKENRDVVGMVFKMKKNSIRIKLRLKTV